MLSARITCQTAVFSRSFMSAQSGEFQFVRCASSTIKPTVQHADTCQTPAGKNGGSSKDAKDVPKDLTAGVQGLQGKQIHDFSPAWTRETCQVQDVAQELDQSRMANSLQGTQSRDGFKHTGPKDYGGSNAGSGTCDLVNADSYQHSSNVSLYSVMQSQVPHPYDHTSPTHLNMPCGGDSQQQKYIAGMLNDAHPSHHQEHYTLPDADTSKSKASEPEVSAVQISKMVFITRSYSTGATNGSGGQEKLSQRDKLKRAVREYGSTVVVFHVGISLISLGGFYLAVSSGLDMVSLLQKLGVGERILSSSITTGASTFVVAYALHKIFAPVRIATTLTATPFIVRYLRLKGILKPPKVKKP